MPHFHRTAGRLVLALACAALPGCRITPDEIQRIETENALLREQIQTMRMECEQYRRIDIGVEKPEQDEGGGERAPR